MAFWPCKSDFIPPGLNQVKQGKEVPARYRWERLSQYFGTQAQGTTRLCRLLPVGVHEGWPQWDQPHWDLPCSPQRPLKSVTTSRSPGRLFPQATLVHVGCRALSATLWSGVFLVLVLVLVDEDFCSSFRRSLLPTAVSVPHVPTIGE